MCPSFTCVAATTTGATTAATTTGATTAATTTDKIIAFFLQRALYTRAKVVGTFIFFFILVILIFIVYFHFTYLL